MLTDPNLYLLKDPNLYLASSPSTVSWDGADVGDIDYGWNFSTSTTGIAISGSGMDYVGHKVIVNDHAYTITNYDNFTITVNEPFDDGTFTLSQALPADVMWG